MGGNKKPDPELYEQILQDLLRNHSNDSIKLKRSRIRFKIYFKWYNPFTWKYGFNLLYFLIFEYLKN